MFSKTLKMSLRFPYFPSKHLWDLNNCNIFLFAYFQWLKRCQTFPPITKTLHSSCRIMKHAPSSPAVLFSMEGQACSRGPGPSSALLSSGVSESVLRRPHWDRPGESQPFEVVICPNLREGHQIEMSFDSDRAAFRDREREAEIET